MTHWTLVWRCLTSSPFFHLSRDRGPVPTGQNFQCASFLVSRVTEKTRTVKCINTENRINLSFIVKLDYRLLKKWKGILAQRLLSAFEVSKVRKYGLDTIKCKMFVQFCQVCSVTKLLNSCLTYLWHLFYCYFCSAIVVMLLSNCESLPRHNMCFFLVFVRGRLQNMWSLGGGGRGLFVEASQTSQGWLILYSYYIVNEKGTSVHRCSRLFV